MRKNDCPVVRDLMPLVIDRVASDESRRLVEEHIDACEACRAQYEAAKAALPEAALAEYEEEQRRFANALRTLKRTRLKRRMLAVVLSAILCVVAGFGGLFAYDRLFWKQSVVVDSSLYALSLARLRNGTIVVTADTDGLCFQDASAMAEEYWEEWLEEGESVFYCYYATAPIHKFYPAEDAAPQLFMTIPRNDGDPEIVEIRQGKRGDSVPIWTEGEAIPDASPEMETYFALVEQWDAWFDSLPATEDGKVSVEGVEDFPWENRLWKARLAVPEWK